MIFILHRGGRGWGGGGVKEKKPFSGPSGNSPLPCGNLDEPAGQAPSLLCVAGKLCLPLRKF